jgi:hypothetical protein
VTPFLFLVLAAYGLFMAVLAFYSTRAMLDEARTSKAAKRR